MTPRTAPTSALEFDSGLLEREAELEAIAASIRRASDGAGSVVLIEGPPGIGKSALLEAAREAASRSGVVVLRARGAELEHEFPFGVVRQLFERAVVDLSAAERDEVLSGAAALAAALFEGEMAREKSKAAPGESFPLLHGLHWLTANLASVAPLLLAVDDLHWADEASLRFLHYLAGRIDELPVLLIGAARSTEPEAPVPLIEEIGSEAVVRTLTPAPLTERGAETVLGGAFGEAPDPEFSHSAWRASGGNPFLLTELVRALAADGVEPSAESAARVGEITPEAVRRSVLSRLARAPDADREVARAAAVLTDGAEPRTVAALSGLDLDAVRGSADSLARAGVIEPGSPLRFKHALVRAAIYGDLPSGERARRHARAAEALDASGADAEAVAAHLLLTDPAGDPGRIVILRRAGAEAMARGAPDVGADLVRRALAEAPEGPDRRAVLTELGRAEIRARVGAGIDPLRAALDLSEDPGERAEIARLLSLSLVQAAQLDEAAGVLRAELDRGNALPRDARLELECDLVGISIFTLDADLRAAADAILASHAEPEQTASPAERALLAGRAYRLVQRGEDAAQAASLIERALEQGLLDEFPLGSPFHTAAVHGLLCSGAKSARRWAAEGLRRAHAMALPFGVAQSANVLSITALREGRIAEAESLADESVRGCLDHGILIGIHTAVASLVDAMVERGSERAAWEQLERLELTGELPDLFTAAWLPESRGRLRAALGDLEGARDDLLDAGRRFRRWGVVGPGISSWRSDAALVHLQLGDEDDARRLAAEDLELARRFGAPRPIGIALRALGLVEGGEAGSELLSEAVEALASCGDRLGQARALTDLGAARRRADQRREAREPLREGLELAARCGATVLAKRAREELLAAGGRPRRPHVSGVESLTPAELRTARMAADGLTNREIAQALFVTLKTVESHLRHAYRKLDVADRSELPAALEAA